MVDFLKLDVEGAEGAVVRELERSGALRRIEQLLIEYHHHIRADRDEFSELLRILEDNDFGYQIAGSSGPPLRGETFQDIHVYAYRKPETVSG